MTTKAPGAGNRSQFARCLLLLACAFVAGLSIPTAWFGILRVSVLWPINTPSWWFMMTWTLVCVSSYLGAALLLMAIRAARINAFNWALLAVCGALVLAIVYTFRPPPISQIAFADLQLLHFRDALGTAFWLSLFTLPISALVYYSTSFVLGRSTANKPRAGAFKSSLSLRFDE